LFKVYNLKMNKEMNKLMLFGGAVILAASLLFTAARNSEF